MVELRNLQAGYTGRAVVSGVSLELFPGQVLALLGPNGCGKSTLLRTVLGLLPPLGGEVLLDGMPLRGLTPRQIAQKIAWLPQTRPVPRITARRMVLHGRFPHLSYPRRYRREDIAAVERALEQADAGQLGDRLLTELSGGQRQNVYLAMALAQETETLLMDEPTTYLDIRHQLAFMDLARRLADQGKAVVLVLHDLCLALETADRAALLADGRLQAAGTPEALYASGLLEQTMGIALGRFQGEDGWHYYYIRGG